jgi:hypothetical protein
VNVDRRDRPNVVTAEDRITVALKQLRGAWSSERLAAYLEGLASWAGPLAEAKASHEGHMRIRIHQGRLAKARITEDRRIAYPSTLPQAGRNLC